MTWYSITYVALSWITSLIIVAVMTASWYEREDTLVAAIGMLAILACTVGLEIAKWWRAQRAIGKLYLRACERLQESTHED